MPERRTNVSIDEWLATEQQEQQRYEFHSGTIIPVGDGGPQETIDSLARKTLVSNLITLLSRACDNHTEGSRVFQGVQVQLSNGDILHPAVVVSTSARNDEFTDAVLNPTIVIEIQAHDADVMLGVRPRQYLSVPSVTSYLIIDAASPTIYLLRSLDQTDSHSLQYAEGLAATIAVPEVRATLRLAELYEGVRFHTPNYG